jgi:hypothetical protein
VTFLTPATGTVAAPPDYIFGGAGLGIVATNSGDQLSANDFYDPSVGSGAPGKASPGAALLRLTFSASTDAAGRFGIFAVRGADSTQWTASSPTTRCFGNVPNGSGLVRIGDILVPSSVVPEPSSFALAATALIVVLSAVPLRPRRRIA